MQGGAVESIFLAGGDGLALLRDPAGSVASVSESMRRNQPVRNKQTPSVLSPYTSDPAFAPFYARGRM